jgi:signal transduction histidine kinase
LRKVPRRPKKRTLPFLSPIGLFDLARFARQTTVMAGRLRTYRAVVSTIGLALLVMAAAMVDVDRVRAEWPVIATLAAFLFVGQFFSIPLSGPASGVRVLINGPFAFAIVLYGGLGAAVVLQAAAGLLADGIARKRVQTVAFNSGTHTIGLVVGSSVWMALGGGRSTGIGTLAAILVGAAVFIVVKAGLFAIRVQLDNDLPFTARRLLRHAIGLTVLTQAVVLVVVLSAGQIAVLLVALGLPTVATYIALAGEASANLGRSEAEETARREAELRAQEHELRLQQLEMTRKLQETDRMKDDLLAMVSHELRNPLATVLGVLRLLSSGATLNPEERQEMLEMGDRQARRLRSLIEQLLLAARFERGEVEYPSSGAELVEADAAELVFQAATEAQAGHREHPIRVECDGTLPVRVAPDAVLQILGNLLDNACKYSPDQRLVRLIAERNGAHAVLAVEDDGAGVAAGERDRIFERFTQLGNGRSGLGLGLYIAKQLARAQGGELVLTEPRHAGGARFELRLPLRERINQVPQNGSSGQVARAVGQPS